MAPNEVWMHMCVLVYVDFNANNRVRIEMWVWVQQIHVCATAILTIIEGQFQIFQRFSSSKLVQKTAERCFVALN